MKKLSKLSPAGFGAVEGLLIVVLVALIAGVGYYVFTQSQKNDSTSAPQTSVTAPATTEEKSLEDLDPKDSVSFTLPEGWTEKDCKGYILAIIPAGTEEPNCKADQPNTIVSLAVISADLDPALYKDVATCEADKNLTEGTAQTCSAVTVDEKAGVKVVGTHTAEGPYGEAVTTTKYLFKTGENFIVAEHVDYDDTKTDDVSDDFVAFVESFKFK